MIGFFDDGIPKGTRVSHFGRVLGGIETVNAWPEPLLVVLAFGNPKITRRVYGRIMNPLIEFPSLIPSDFRTADPQTFRIGEGNIIKEGCYASTDVTIGNFNLLNGDVVLGHDSKIGDFNTIMPGVRISGEVTVHNECLLGAMSFIHQGLTIPDEVTIGPLSALLTKPAKGTTYIGNPAKKLKF